MLMFKCRECCSNSAHSSRKRSAFEPCAFAAILALAGALRTLLQASVRYRAVPGARASTAAVPVAADCRLGSPVRLVGAQLAIFCGCRIGG